MLRLLLFILLCCEVTAERYAYLFFATSKAHDRVYGPLTGEY